MFLKIDKPLSIENLKTYPAEVEQQLAEILISGVAARMDPNRKNFYDLYHGDRGFFIHVRPCRHKVLLLATWLTELPHPEIAWACA